MSRPRGLSDEDRARLESVLGHSFSDRARLDRALTHASVRTANRGDYERLEFLGDRVLGLCVAEMLFKTFGTAQEGELSVRLNQLVSADSCADVAEEMDLQRYIRIGSDLKNVPTKRMKNVRADVVESLIAALYLDGGLDVARAFITRYWAGRARTNPEARRDAKTELQEWAHAAHAAQPAYRVDERSGPDHDPHFVVTVMVGELAPASGAGRSKRMAEQVAATNLLVREGIWKPEGK